MPERPPAILQVSTGDLLGGAERVAWNLFQSYRSRGQDAWLAVGRKRSDDPNVLRIPHDTGAPGWRRFWWRTHDRLQPWYSRGRFGRWMCRATHRLAEPAGWIDALRGVEDFRYPGTWRLLDLPPGQPDVLHCHNLHGTYFDLRALPWLSRQVPVLLTLHDAWLLSGHCAHSFECERWRSGCGACPDLTTYPAIRRDATDYNWRRKRDIFARSRLYVATPSRWLMNRIEQSMLAPAIREGRVIPNGVDLSVFCPGDRVSARKGLQLPEDARVLLFAAFGVRNNPWKDYDTMRSAVIRAANTLADKRVIFVALGERRADDRIGRAEIRYIPYTHDACEVARFYQVADLYVHAARADTFPNSVIEALACGTPVVATAVGGIPEQVRSLPPTNGHAVGVARPADFDRATGILVPSGDAGAMASAIVRLLNDEDLRCKLGANAVRDSRERFSLERQVEAYVSWYREMLAGSAVGSGGSSSANESQWQRDSVGSAAIGSRREESHVS